MARIILRLGIDLLDKNKKLISIGDEVVMIARGGYLIRGKLNRETEKSIFIDNHMLLKSNCWRNLYKL
jgi:hypothetical protein